MERKCIVCGNVNPAPRSNFCCNSCKQKYYYEKNKKTRAEYKKEYYQEHKQEYIDRVNDWRTDNKEKWNEYQKDYIKNIRTKIKEGKNENEQ